MVFNAAELAPAVGEVVEVSEQIGLHSLWPMDHFFQLGEPIGPHEDPMLEGWATVGWAAGRTRRLEFGTLVTGVHYRHPGVLAKYATTLDVLSGGRVWMGIGAGWHEAESKGLGVPYPPLAERFERLEETLQILHRMFDGDETPFAGKHYHLEHPMNRPAPVRKPPIMVGGAGEQKTLRMVAQYADACNIFERLDVGAKLRVLAEHCERQGRSYDDIVKTTAGMLDADRDVARTVDRLGELAELGVDMAILNMTDLTDLSVLDHLAEVVPAVESFGRPTPALLQQP